MFWYQKILLMAQLAQTTINTIKEIKKPNNHKDDCKCVVCKRKNKQKSEKDDK